MPNIALVLSGAVSLGSWEAGVLDELLGQLDRLNRDRETQDHFKIDVITGASAGALTAAMVGRAVMLDPDAQRLTLCCLSDPSAILPSSTWPRRLRRIRRRWRLLGC